MLLHKQGAQSNLTKKWASSVSATTIPTLGISLGIFESHMGWLGCLVLGIHTGLLLKKNDDENNATTNRILIE